MRRWRAPDPSPTVDAPPAELAPLECSPSKLRRVCRRTASGGEPGPSVDDAEAPPLPCRSTPRRMERPLATPRLCGASSSSEATLRSAAASACCRAAEAATGTDGGLPDSGGCDIDADADADTDAGPEPGVLGPDRDDMRIGEGLAAPLELPEREPEEEAKPEPPAIPCPASRPGAEGPALPGDDKVPLLPRCTCCMGSVGGRTRADADAAMPAAPAAELPTTTLAAPRVRATPTMASPPSLPLLPCSLESESLRSCG